MIRYYHKTRFLGYGVGINPLSGSIVLVTDDNEYRAYRRDQITHHVVGGDNSDERVKRTTTDVRYDPFTELPKRY